MLDRSQLCHLDKLLHRERFTQELLHILLMIVGRRLQCGGDDNRRTVIAGVAVQLANEVPAALCALQMNIDDT